MNKHHYCIIMAGGSGDRFWPLSRENNPKQFLRLTGNDESFLSTTYQMCQGIVPKENILVITLGKYRSIVEEQLPDSNLKIIGEIGVGVMELQSGNIEALAVADGNGTQIIANNPDLVKCEWQFEVAEAYEANVCMIHKGNTALLAAVNEALAKFYDEGVYAEWYEEALEIAAGESALEVSIEDAEEEPAA